MHEHPTIHSIPFLRAEFPHDVINEVERVLTSGYVGAGTGVELFERDLASYLTAPYVICTSSCTAALSLAYDDIGIGQGDVVLTTPMTCAATNTPLLHAKARIAWLDIDPLSGNVTADTLDTGLRQYPNAKAVVVVDWAGTPCDYDALADVAAAHGVPVVLDAAQSFGSLYRDALCPRADYVCYSFGPTKMLSSVEGGAMIVRSEPAAERLRAARWYGIDRARRDPTEFWEYDVVRVGHRFTSNDVFASIGRQMLRRFPHRLAIHRSCAAIYETELGNIAGITLATVLPGTVPNRWMFTIHVGDRARFMRALHGAGIHAATPHKRNDRLTCFSGTAHEDLPGVARFGDSYVCLPIGPWVQEEDVQSICDVIRRGW